MSGTSTLVIAPIGTQTANTPFTVTGTYQLNSGTWQEKLAFEDSGDNVFTPIATPATTLTTTSFTFAHPGLPVGTHTIKVKDPLTGNVVTSNSFTVTAAKTITITAPAGVYTNASWTLKGTLSGYSSAPALTYRLDGGTPTAVTGVSTSAFSVTVPGLAAGSHSVVVSDGTSSSTTTTFTVANAPVSIVPDTPTGVVAGQPFTFTGTLTGYTAAPSLNYHFDSSSSLAMTGVTKTGWSMTLTAPSSVGTHVIAVSDGTNSQSVSFTVSGTAKAITTYAPSGAVAGSPFTFKGALTNYASAPSLTYSIDGGARAAVTGVSNVGWTMTLTAPAAGSHTVNVSDGTITSANVSFTVASAQTTVTRRYQDQPGGSNNVWNTPIGSGATALATTDAQTIAARNGGFINSTSNYGEVVWDASPAVTTTPVRFTGHGGDYANTAYPNNSGTPYDITANCVVGSYAPGPYPGDNGYSFIDEINFPGKYFQFGPLAIQNLQPGIGTQAAYFGGEEDAMSDTFCQDWETGHANFSTAAGLIRAYDLDPTRNPTLIPIATLQGYDPTQPSTAKVTRINHVLAYMHDAKYLKSNTDPDTTRNPTYPNGFLLPNSWPQLYQDYQNGINVYTGDLIYGSQLYIPAGTPFPTALRGNVAAIQIFDALINFGSITRDQASGGYHLRADQNVAQSWIDSANAALPTIVQLLRVMSNQHQGGQSFTTFPANGPGTRLVALPPPLAPIGGSGGGGGGSGGSPVTWSKTDVAGGMSVDTTGYVATSGGSSTAGASPQGVRASTALTQGVVVGWEVAMNSLTQNWATGVADSTFLLTNGGGIGSDIHAIGAYPSTGAGSQPAQTVYYNNNQLTTGNGVSDAAGDVMSIVVNGTNFFFSTPAMRTTNGVVWNNSASADPIKNVGGFSFASMSAPYYPVFSEGETGGGGTLNDGSKPFSSFMTLFLNQNPSVKTLSGQAPSSSTTQTIVPTQPVGVSAGSPFTFSGTLTGYTNPPPMTYSINGGAPYPVTGVTATGWSMTLTIATAGSTSISVTDGTVTGTTAAFTVSSTAVSTRVPAPLSGSVSKGTWLQNQKVAQSGLPGGGGFMYYDLLVPANYDPKYVYPIVVLGHENDEGMNGGSYPSSNLSTQGSALGTNLSWDAAFNTVNMRTKFPAFLILPYCDQTKDTSGATPGNNFGGYADTPGSTANAQGVLGIIAAVEATYSIDKTRIYGFGCSLGAIGLLSWLVDFNTWGTAAANKSIFTAGIGLSDQLYRPNVGGGSNSGAITAMKNVPYFAIGTPNDNNVAIYDQAAWQQYTGNSNYPTVSDYTSGGVAKCNAPGTSYYFINTTVDVPWNQGFAQLNEDGGIATPIFTWLFSQINGPVSASVNITGVNISASQGQANSPIGTSVGTLSATSTGGALTSPSFTIASQTGGSAGGVVPYGCFIGNPGDAASGSYPGYTTQYTNLVTAMGGLAPQYNLTYMDQTYAPGDASFGWTAQGAYFAGIAAGDANAKNMIPVIGLPFGYNPGSGAVNLFSVLAAGTWDTQITGMLGGWKSNGFTTLYIRPAWEFNLPNNYAVTSANLTSFIAAWKHVYTTIKNYASANGMTISVIWNPNVGQNQNSPTLTVAQQYPGNAYVDVLGIDTYGAPIDGGHTPGATTTDATQYLVTTMIAMGIANNKPICGCEVGGIDNPFATAFVSAMTNTGASVAFVCLWDIDDSSGTLSWSNPGDNQTALANIWKGGFGTNGTVKKSGSPFKIVGTAVQFASAAVAVGTYTLQVKVTANNAVNSPQTYPVTINVVAGGSGYFKVSQTGTYASLTDPNGVAWKGYGICCLDGVVTPSSVDSTGSPMTKQFPKMNVVRVACYSYQAPSAYQAFITSMTALKIVVILENHQNFAGNYGGSNGTVFTGQRLTDESNWYAALATAYAGNPYVWFGTNNEPSDVGVNGDSNPAYLSTWHKATYDAIRGTGNKNPILIDVNNSYTWGTNGGMTASVYLAMTNVMWDYHSYDWLYSDPGTTSGYSSNLSVIKAGILANVQLLQQLKSADGIMPVFCAEYGNSTSGSSIDAGGVQNDQGIQSAVDAGQIVGCCAWCWDMGNNGVDDLGNGNGLTVMGKQVASWIATNPNGASSGGSTSAAALKTWFANTTGSGVVSGQFIEKGTMLGGVNACVTATGHQPGMLLGDMWGYDNTGPAQSGANSYLLDQWKKKGLVGYILSIPSPAGGGGSASGNAPNPTNLVTPGTAVNTQFNTTIDQICGVLKDLQTSGVGAVCIRPFHEMNGNWFWWGTQNFTPSQFIAMWRYFYNRVVTTNGLTNLVWCYTINAGISSLPDNRYPGDAYVDIVGYDLYSSDPGGDTADYNTMLSTYPNKPLWMSEFGPNGPGAGDPSFDLSILTNALKNNLPKVVLWIEWGGNSGGAGWGFDEVSNVAALKDARVLNAGEISFFP